MATDDRQIHSYIDRHISIELQSDILLFVSYCANTIADFILIFIIIFVIIFQIAIQ
jgi:hypothetical protein